MYKYVKYKTTKLLDMYLWFEGLCSIFVFHEITCIVKFMEFFIIILCQIFLYFLETLDNRVLHTCHRGYQLAVSYTAK